MTVSKLLKASFLLVTAFGAYAQTCPGGIEGISAKDIACCPLDCGSCGGKGCASRPGGASACCGGRILASDMYCDETNEAPCIVGSRLAGMCTGDIEGISANDIVCCPLGCGSCGGKGCASRWGGASACCSGRILASDMYCDETNEAPCIVGSRPESESSDSSEEEEESSEESESESSDASEDEEESSEESESESSDSSEEEEESSEESESESASASSDESESSSSDE